MLVLMLVMMRLLVSVTVQLPQSPSKSGLVVGFWRFVLSPVYEKDSWGDSSDRCQAQSISI